MKKLENSFRHNGLLYTLIKRNEKVAMFGIGGNFSDEIRHWEISKIQIRNDKYGIREHIPQDELFGKDGSQCFASEKKALDYYDELSLKLNQEVPEIVLGVEENNEVMSEYQLEEF